MLDVQDHASLKHTHVVFVQMPNVCLELLHPVGQDSPVADFLRNNPNGGVHHVSITVRLSLPSGVCCLQFLVYDTMCLPGALA